MANHYLVTIVTFMGLLGIPSIFSMTMYCINKCNKYTNQLKILMRSQQEQMKTNLFEQYKKYISQGWIDLEDLSIWESNYQAYHELGKNGVMDSKRDELLKLPNKKEVS